MADFVHAGVAPFFGDVEQEVAVALEVAERIAAEASAIAETGAEIEGDDLADGEVAIAPVQGILAKIKGLVD